LAVCIAIGVVTSFGQGIFRATRRGTLILATIVWSVCPSDPFGQREHFLLFLALPCLLHVGLTSSGLRILCAAAMGLGLAAGLGFCLKPHYLLVPLALKAYRITVTRRIEALWRPETLGLAATVPVYMSVIAWLAPNYLSRIALCPGGLQPVLQQSAARRALADRDGHAAIGLPHLGLWRAVPKSSRGSARHFVTAYTIEPHAGHRGCLPGLDRHSCRQRCRLSQLQKKRFAEITTPYVARYATDGSIVVLGSNVSAGFPLVNFSQVGWSSRFPTLWLLAGAVHIRTSGEAGNGALLDEMEGFTRDAVIA
jgi:hypothetical protein